VIPRAFLGERDGPGIYELDRGHSDDGAAIEVRAESRPLGPAGPDGDCSFDRLYLMVTWSMAATLRVTPLLDEEPLPWFDLELTGGAARKTAIFERELAMEKDGYMAALRGTWFAVRIETVGSLGAGDLILDGAQLDFTILEPSKTRVPV
jgi:hypothetical protein